MGSPTHPRLGQALCGHLVSIMGSTLETGDGDSFALPTTQVGACIEMFLKGKLGVLVFNRVIDVHYNQMITIGTNN